MKTLKFKLYNHKRNRLLAHTINVSGIIWNHCIALHRRYYRRFKKHLNSGRLKSHIAKLRRRISWWQVVGSQAVQDIIERIDKAYQAFFGKSRRGVRPPKFKRVKRYRSFTLKQAGYKLLNGGRIRIGNRVYQYWNSSEIEGTVKTVTVKRTPLGEYFISVVVQVENEPVIKFESGKAAGFDFGLKTFLTCSEPGWNIECPEFFKASLNELRKASKALSSKVKGSNSWERARLNLNRKHEKIVNQRRDWFWKLAHKLTDEFDVLCFESLNLDGMKRLWGRKVSDLAFGEFIQILKWVAKKKGKTVTFIDQWYPSSKTCSQCGHVHSSLKLEDRRWRCPSCHSENDRDHNAALNIKKVGISTLGLGDVRQVLPAIPA